MNMWRHLKGFLFLMAAIALLGGCAMQQAQRPSIEGFTPVDLNAKVRSGRLMKKVDNFLVIFDASSSMNGQYQGESKLVRALEIAQRLNQTIPDVALQGGLRMFGRRAFFSLETTTLLYGMTSYTKQGFSEGLDKIRYGRGYSPMELAIAAAENDLSPAKGKIALIVISDGKDMGSAPLLAARHLAAGLEGRICIYTVQVGDNEEGRTLLQQIAKVSGCGESVNGDDILSGEGMARFVEKAFFQKAAVQVDSDGDGVFDDVDQCPNTPKGVQVDEKGCPIDSDGDGVADYLDKCPNTPRGVQVDKNGCALDTDGDGIPDYLDKCPNTPKGAKVNDRGCWILKGLSFDTAKWDIKPSQYPILDDVVRILKRNPSLRIEIQGHTDNRGAAEYNRKLSEKRAQAVMEYLLKKGISSARLTAAGYGFSRPVATNTTAAGRAKNRRVELKPLY
jgi:OOP family OmpA-OmpF porin